MFLELNVYLAHDMEEVALLYDIALFLLKSSIIIISIIIITIIIIIVIIIILLLSLLLGWDGAGGG